jgi:hypothetical protein
MVTRIPTRVDLGDGLPVKITAALNSGKGKLVNLSARGAYVVTGMLLLPQAQVRLRIVLPTERRWVETEAVVAWENRGPVRRGGLPPGYGLRFLKVPEETAQMIRGHLTPLASAPPPTDSMDAVAGRDGKPAAASDFGRGEEDGPPYRLSEKGVVAHTPEGAKGVFVLSYDRTLDARVGRADDDLRAALTSFIGEYAFFYHEIIEGQDERFSRECELYHRLGGDRGQLDTDEHPASPTGLACPVCAAAEGGTQEG